MLSELRGGDAWDSSIRKQIKTCALFIPLISRTTGDRVEGYSRLEWKLAVDRSHLMAADQAFSCCRSLIDSHTADNDEQVPERFREVPNRTRALPGGVASAAFVERVRRLLSRRIGTADWDCVGRVSRERCAGNAKRRPAGVALEGGAHRADRC